MTKSRAWVMAGPGKLDMEEFEVPKITDDAALLKVEACGICGTDKHIFLGHSPNLPFPLIPGHEFIGHIVEMGSKANESMAVFGGKMKVGDRVAIAPASMPCGNCINCLKMPGRPAFCTNKRYSSYGFSSTKNPPRLKGGYAEYVYLEPETYIFQVPKDMPLERAVLTEPMATGLRAVERGYSPGESFMGHGYGVGRSVMVLGTGPIGIMIIASLRYSGAGLIIAQDLFKSRLDLAKKFGADLLIDGTLPLKERMKQVKDATEGLGPDVVIEAAGAPPAFREALDFVRRGGKFVEVGHFTDSGTIDIHPFYICFKDVDIHGSWGYPMTIFQDVIDLLSRTTLPLEDVVTHKLPLDELPKGIDLCGTEGAGKVVITP